MTPATAIDVVIRDYDGSSPVDATNAGRRVQLLGYLQQMNDLIHNFREWPWTYTANTISITAGNKTATLPATFMRVGQHGGLFETATRQLYREIPVYTLMRLRYLLSNPYPYVFSIIRPNLEIPQNATTTLSLTLIHRTLAQTLADGSTEMTIPDAYGRSVILPALIAASRRSVNDARPDWGALLKDGLSMMCAAENPCLSEIQELPVQFPGAG